MAALQLDELMERYSQKVYNLAFRFSGSREDSEDIVQETFLEVHKGLDGFRGESQVYTWIYRIAYNKCIQLHKSKPGCQVVITNETIEAMKDRIPNEVAEWFEIPERSALMLELLAEIRRLCNHFLIYRLPDNQRATYIMRNILGLSYSEIAEITGTSENVVKARLNRARNSLSELVYQKNSTCLWLNENKTNCCKSRIGFALAMDNDLLRRVKAQAYQAGYLKKEEMGPPAAQTIDDLFGKFPELIYYAKDIPQRA